MKKYFFIGAGGFLGAVLRFYIKGIHIYHYNEAIPLNTLFINISGSFILGLFLTIAFEVWEINSDLRLGVASGFLGAFTTFSAVCKETALLIFRGDYYSALSYVTVSTVLGLAAVYFGTVVAREVIAKYVDKHENDSVYQEHDDAADGEVN